MSTIKETKKADAPTKASTAREFMKKIGAFSKNPPEGWANKVEDHLKEKGFSVPPSNKVQIYTIRSEAMKKELKAKSKNQSPEANKPKRKISGSVNAFTIKDLSAAKNYAASNGGILKCIEALKALQSLSE